MLTPELLPEHVKPKTTVVHRYPDDWDDAEVAEHRFDQCPCVPDMWQLLGERHGYRWLVAHRRIPKTEEIPL